jgi:hypothetical protein
MLKYKNKNLNYNNKNFVRAIKKIYPHASIDIAHSAQTTAAGTA